MNRKQYLPLAIATTIVISAIITLDWQLHRELRRLSLSLAYTQNAATAARSACQTRRQAMDQMCQEGAPGVLAELCEPRAQ